MSHAPTAEQRLIIERVTGSDANILVNARAGAAKTTTIEMLTSAVSYEVLCLAFNKKIATELQARLPANAKAQTLNSLGHRAWADFCPQRLVVNAGKNREIAREVVNEFASPLEAKEIFEKFGDLLDGISHAKTSGYLPAGQHSMARPLVEDSSFFDLCEIRYSSLEKDIIDEVVRRSFKLALRGQIDYDDQIYLPAIMPVSFPQYRLTAVDEAQDLSPINHVMLRKMVRKNRLIAVGDPCQAIYGFRGASEKSMGELQSMFDMEELYLTMCFRSAENVVRNAHWRAPDMRWRPGAPAGIVSELESWSPATLRDGDAIICRNNAPLFSMAIQLLRARLRPKLSNGDIVAGLKKVLVKLGPADLSQTDALQSLGLWAAAQRQRHKDSQKVEDQIACLHLFIEESDTLGGAIRFLEEIAAREGSIELMTGHKSKGLEFDRVFFLDKHLVRPHGQDQNLKYVIETRAKNELYYVRSEAWSDFDAPAEG